ESSIQLIGDQETPHTYGAQRIIVFVRDHRIRIVLHWQGGDHTELEVIKNRSGLHRQKTDVEIEKIIQALARLMPDARIAALLN
ncbi:MAG: hypothetical protein ACREV1_10005, partial [Gammaproteobacteria bacterium]